MTSDTYLFTSAFLVLCVFVLILGGFVWYALVQEESRWIAENLYGNYELRDKEKR